MFRETLTMSLTSPIVALPDGTLASAGTMLWRRGHSLGLILMITLIGLSSSLQAQTFKCQDSKGKTTYSDTQCGPEYQIIRTQSSGSERSAAESNASYLAQGNACQADSRKFCYRSNGGTSVEDCLIDHQQEISDSCYNALKQQLTKPGGTSSQGTQGGQDNDSRTGATQGGSPGVLACGRDAKQFCSSVQPGGGRVINCLLDHQQDLSEACYRALEKRKSQ